MAVHHESAFGDAIVAALLAGGWERRLIAAQFPQWSGLPVTPVEVDGHRRRPTGR